MDVHRKRTQVAIMQQDGTEILNRNVANDPAELSPLLGTLEPGTPVVFEAAYGWGWLAELLHDWDPEPHLAHAKNCKAIASARPQERQGRRTHARPPAAQRPAAGSVDRPARGPGPALASSPPRISGALRDHIEEPHAWRLGRSRHSLPD
jgi:hypothetical protein